MVDCSPLCRPHISIHALRGEGDSSAGYTGVNFAYFNPRPPWGGRLLVIVAFKFVIVRISIHALRGEGDVVRYP